MQSVGAPGLNLWGAPSPDTLSSQPCGVCPPHSRESGFSQTVVNCLIDFTLCPFDLKCIVMLIAGSIQLFLIKLLNKDKKKPHLICT